MKGRLFATNLVVASLLVTALVPAGAVSLTEAESPMHDHTEVAYKSPISQFVDNTPISQVACPDGLELIMKKTSGMPACVTPSTFLVLIERGWGLHVLGDSKDVDNNADLLKDSKGRFDVETQEVAYFDNYTGYLAVPVSGEEALPGIILIHEWWGLNDNMKEVTENLASHGYVALAVDLYGTEAVKTSDEARQLVSSYDPQSGLYNMHGAVEYLRQTYGVDKVGSIGWCFGGGQSLALALNSTDMDATVIYYGSVTSDKQRLAAIHWPVLGVFAGLDTGIPVDTVKEFDRALDELEIPNEVYIYPNVNHAFANPSGERYAPEEAKDAWDKTIKFLHAALK